VCARFGMLQCVAVCCSVLQCDAVCCSVLQCVAESSSVLQCIVDLAHVSPSPTSYYCNALQHAATHCIDCNTLQHNATHCNTLQHTATHCNAGFFPQKSHKSYGTVRKRASDYLTLWRKMTYKDKASYASLPISLCADRSETESISTDTFERLCGTCRQILF